MIVTGFLATRDTIPRVTGSWRSGVACQLFSRYPSHGIGQLAIYLG